MKIFRVLALLALLTPASLVAQTVPPKALTGQSGLTIGNMTAIQPSLCGNTGTCPGTPTWANSTNKNSVQGCYVTVETNNVRWWANGTAPTTSAGSLWLPGNYYIAGNANVVNLKLIATGANATVSLECFRS